MPNRPKNEKKKSGAAATGPIPHPASPSSASSMTPSAQGMQHAPLRESDFLTGNQGNVAPRPGFLPTQADIDLKKYPQMRFPHGQVAPAYAKDYVQSWQNQDEKFRQKNANNPHESLMSIHNRGRTGKNWTLSAGLLPHRHFATCVTPDFKFQQLSIHGSGPGICLTLSFAFMICRRLGMEYKQVFATFLKNATMLVKTQNTLAERSKVAGFHLLYSHQSANNSFSYGIVEDLLLPLLSLPLLSAPQAQQAAVPKKAGKYLPYLPPVGHFAVHPKLGAIHAILALGAVKLASGAFVARRNAQAEWSARGITATWAVPRMAEFLPQTRDDKNLFDEDSREKMLHPQIGAHLFSGMQRSLRKSRADGKVIEATPYFLITNQPGANENSHAMVVEFNTCNGRITTPRGIFDPNYGWAAISENNCSLDFELLLSGIFYMYQTPPPPGSMDFAGALLAYQLLHVVDA